MFGRDKVATLVAEFLGTGVLTLLILTVQRSTIGVPFFIAAAAGLAVVLMAFAVGGASKAHFNPAITIGMWTTRRVETVTAILYIAMQLLGALAAYYTYIYFTNAGELKSIGGDFKGTILAAEAVGAGLFAFGFLAAVTQGVTRAVTASFAGLSLMLGILAASSASLGLINPAVALGVKAWVWGTYVAGPILGAVIGANLYHYLYTPATIRGTVRPTVASSSSAKRPTKKKSKR